MASPWCRLWSDMPNDPKWRTIARVSKQSIGNVIAVYIHMMTCASTQPNPTERGRTLGWRDEDVATALDIETEQVEAIRAAMQGRVLDDDYLMGWDRRQSIREDEGSAGRSKAFREREKEKKQAAEEAARAVENATRTQPNATERKETPEVDVEVDVDVEKEKSISAVAPQVVLELDQDKLDAIERELDKHGTVEPAVVAFTLPTNTSEEFPIVVQRVAEFQLLYPAVDVGQQLKNMRAWLISNPTRRKTKSGMMKFVNSWLAKQQNEAPQARPAARPSGRPSINSIGVAAGADDDIFNQMRKTL